MPAIEADWGSPHARSITTATLTELAARRLSSGSMGPKAEAAARFVRETGGTALIGALTDARAMLAGDAGTRVLPDVEPERAAESSRSPTPFSAGPAVGTTQPIRGAARMQTRPPMKIIARHTNQAKEMSPMFKKIIWATDGSNAADLALPHAKTLAIVVGTLGAIPPSPDCCSAA